MALKDHLMFLCTPLISEVAMEISIDALCTPFFICLTLASFVSILWFFIRKHSDENNPKIPPSPPSLPIIGHLHLLTPTRVHITLKNLASRYGPFMSIRTGEVTQYVVSNGSTAKQIFKVHDIKFAARPELGSPEDQPIFTEFTGMDYGKKWVFLKKVLMLEFFSSRQIDRFGDIRREELVKLLLFLEKKSKDKEEEACNVSLEIMGMINNSVSRMMLSTCCCYDSREEIAEIREITRELTVGPSVVSLENSFSFVIKYDLLGAERKMKSLLTRFDALMDRIMLRYEGMNERGSKERQDMLGILLNVTEDATAEVKITRTDVKGLFMDLFLGGSDSTGIAIQWALAELLNRPASLKKLQQEIDATVGLNRIVQKSDISNLPYLQAVVKETLRLHPSLPLVFRRCREGCKINGYSVAKNTTVVVNLYAINRDPNEWEDATDFIPERFLSSPVDPAATGVDNPEDNRGQNFSYVPFGGGRRGCPGAGIALAALHSSLAALVQCFEWKLKGGEKVDMEEGEGFSTPMLHPLICHPILRVNPSVLRFVH